MNDVKHLAGVWHTAGGLSVDSFSLSGKAGGPRSTTCSLVQTKRQRHRCSAQNDNRKWAGP